MAFVRKAVIADIPLIKNLIDSDSERGLLLPVSYEYVGEHIRDYIVAFQSEESSEIMGCSSLHIYSRHLAEIRSLIVAENFRMHGIGRELLEFSVREGIDIGVDKVFALTRAPEFFTKYSFSKISKSKLPEKVYRDCLRCAKFHNCDEIAVIREL